MGMKLCLNLCSHSRNPHRLVMLKKLTKNFQGYTTSQLDEFNLLLQCPVLTVARQDTELVEH